MGIRPLLTETTVLISASLCHVTSFDRNAGTCELPFTAPILWLSCVLINKSCKQTRVAAYHKNKIFSKLAEYYLEPHPRDELELP